MLRAFQLVCTLAYAGALMLQEDGTGHPNTNSATLRFENVQAMVGFIGYPHSGHTLLGFLLDAHPKMMIADEYKLLGGALHDQHLNTKNKLYNAIARENKNQCKNHKNQCNMYTIPNWPWQNGRAESNQPLVMGWKKGGGTSRLGFKALTRELKALYDVTGTPIKLFHNHRNPWDQVSTMAMHKVLGKSRDKAYKLYNKNVGAGTKQPANFMKHIGGQIGEYSRLAYTNERLIQMLKKDKNALGFPVEVFDVAHSDFIARPREIMKEMCEFIGIPCSAQYLDSTSGIVSKHDHMTRFYIKGWSNELQDRVKKMSQQISFLKNYTYDAPKSSGKQSSESTAKLLQRPDMCWPSMPVKAAPDAPVAEAELDMEEMDEETFDGDQEDTTNLGDSCSEV